MPLAPLDWTVCENALHAWLVSATGLDAAKVVWANQDGPEPTGAFVTLKVLAFTPAPGLDALVQTYDAGGAAGADLILAVDARRQLSVSVQAFSPAVTGPTSARALLAKAQAALALPGVRSGFSAARLASFNASGITDVSAVRETKWQSRASMEVRFHAVDSVSERTTWIATAEVSQEA